MCSETRDDNKMRAQICPFKESSGIRHGIGSSRCDGTITVFLTLSLTIIISLILAVIASARDRSMRMRCEMAMDMGLLSVFGEYNRELLKEFDLYFIDSSYGGEEGSSYYTAERLREYMKYNLNPAKGQAFNFSRDLFALSLEDLQVTMESLATDSSARVFKRQAVRYAKDKYGISLIESLDKNRRDYSQYGIEEYDPAIERRRSENDVLEGAQDAEDEEGNPIEYESPVNRIENARSTILETLLGELHVSDRAAERSVLASERELKTGCGIVACDEDIDSAASNLLFDAYITDRFSSYTNDKGRGGLGYELEYILNGFESDKANLEATAAKLLAVREAANCMYIMSDAQKKGEAELIAGGVAVIVSCPELKDSLTNMILYSWAFAESCVDLRSLLDGHKVPMMKDTQTWVLHTFADALSFKLHLRDGAVCTTGLDYVGYIQILLGLTPSDGKLKRSMDMVECDMRAVNGYEYFKLDNCIEFLEARARIKSRFGEEYEISRYFGYVSMPAVRFPGC